jgi:hypothetical protein
MALVIVTVYRPVLWDLDWVAEFDARGDRMPSDPGKAKP